MVFGITNRRGTYLRETQEVIYSCGSMSSYAVGQSLFSSFDGWFDV